MFVQRGQLAFGLLRADLHIEKEQVARPAFFAGQSEEGDNFAAETVEGLLVTGDAIVLRRQNALAQVVIAVEALAVMDHQLAFEPQAEERQGGVFAAAVTFDGVVAFEIAVAKRAALADGLQHLVQNFGVFGDEIRPARVEFRVLHSGPPVGEIFHGIEEQPAAVVEKLAFIVSDLVKILGTEVEHPAPQGDLLAAATTLSGSSWRASLLRMAAAAPSLPAKRRPGHNPWRPMMNRL